MGISYDELRILIGCVIEKRNATKPGTHKFTDLNIIHDKLHHELGNRNHDVSLEDVKVKGMDNYLTMLYFQRFKISKRGEQLSKRSIHPITTDSEKIENAKNEQSITESMDQLKMIDKMIVMYIDKLKRE